MSGRLRTGPLEGAGGPSQLRGTSVAKRRPVALDSPTSGSSTSDESMKTLRARCSLRTCGANARAPRPRSREQDGGQKSPPGGIVVIGFGRQEDGARPASTSTSCEIRCRRTDAVHRAHSRARLAATRRSALRPKCCTRKRNARGRRVRDASSTWRAPAAAVSAITAATAAPAATRGAGRRALADLGRMPPRQRTGGSGHDHRSPRSARTTWRTICADNCCRSALGWSPRSSSRRRRVCS